jgi:poly(3-hydroxyalkanoate) synthetase
MQDLSDSWLEGTIRAYDGLRRGWSEVFPVQEDLPPTTPFEVIAEHGKLRLRYYRAQGNPQPTPLLLVYALIKRPFILDLQPERSVVETLTRQGFTVYLTDWISPTPDDLERGFGAYVLPKATQAFPDVTLRNTDAYLARSGWDACTGLGSPNAVRLLSALDEQHLSH